MRVDHPDQTKLDEVLDFMNRCDLAEFGEEDTSREDLEQLWSGIDLARDVWIVREEQERIIGYANVAPVGEGFQMDIYVHPTDSPTEVEDDLMQLCLARAALLAGEAPPDSTPSLTGYATSKSLRLQCVYDGAGFSRHTYHYRMHIDLPSPLPAPQWPPNFELSAYQPEAELELYHLIQRAFDWEGHVDSPIEEWRNLVFRGGRFDPQFFVLVRDAGRLVGAALSYEECGSGWIRQLAFHKDYRGQGLGSLLLRHMFYVFQQRGAASVALGVAAVNENAVSFYERNGMHRSREFIEYKLDLAAKY
ncbi:MAG: GNAT family N-acetyltransferase [Anaerolineaceae bacterium]|jgi:ribosomal protein S18 acetylase RimI-like enzyme